MTAAPIMAKAPEEPRRAAAALLVEAGALPVEVGAVEEAGAPVVVPVTDEVGAEVPVLVPLERRTTISKMACHDKICSSACASIGRRNSRTLRSNFLRLNTSVQACQSNDGNDAHVAEPICDLLWVGV